MKKFFFLHPDVIIAGIAFILLVILIGFFSWSINDIIFEIHQSTAVSDNSSEQGFDLQAAAKINFHGVSTSSASSSVITPTPIIIPTSTVSTSSNVATSTTSSAR